MVVAAAIQSLAQLGSVSGRICWCSLDFAAENSPKSGLLCGHNSSGRCSSCKQYRLVHRSGLMVSCLPQKTVLSFATHASRNAIFSPSEHSCVPFASFPLASAVSLQGQSQGSREDQWATDSCHLYKASFPYRIRQDVRMLKLCGGRNWGLSHALLEGSGHVDATDLQAQDSLKLPHESETSSKSIAELYMTEEISTNSGRNHAGRSGILSFYGVHLSDRSEVNQERQTENKWWVSSLWLLGPTALVSSVVLPPFCLRKLFEVVLEDSLVTDFLILFFTEALFYVGVAIFLLMAHRVQQSAGVITWKSANYVSLAYKVSSILTTALGILLPVAAFAVVWPWTGPAAAAALFPYIAGLAVQYGFEQFIRQKKSFVWPLVPIVFQVYRLHQLNRATQLVAGLLYSLRGADATAETLAVNGSLQTLVSMLQLLGMLCLWSLAAFLTYVFCSESQSWESRILASEQI